MLKKISDDAVADEKIMMKKYWAFEKLKQFCSLDFDLDFDFDYERDCFNKKKIKEDEVYFVDCAFDHFCKPVDSSWKNSSHQKQS